MDESVINQSELFAICLQQKLVLPAANQITGSVLQTDRVSEKNIRLLNSIAFFAFTGVTGKSLHEKPDTRWVPFN